MITIELIDVIDIDPWKILNHQCNHQSRYITSPRRYSQDELLVDCEVCDNTCSIIGHDWIMYVLLGIRSKRARLSIL